MRVYLDSITAQPEPGCVRMLVRFGEEPPKTFSGGLANPNCCSVDQELFMRLSDLAVKRYCHCGIYQFELMGIIKAFLADESLPDFPIELGTTSFGLRRPSVIQVFWRRLKRSFYSAWYRWRPEKQ